MQAYMEPRNIQDVISYMKALEEDHARKADNPNYRGNKALELTKDFSRGAAAALRISLQELSKVGVSDAAVMLATTPIENLTSAEFVVGVRIHVEPMPEDFIVTRIGRINYAISIDHGYAYTRPQLIEKYAKVGATYTIITKS